MPPPSTNSDPSPEHEHVFAEARALGFLGPGPVSDGIEHARGFAAGIDEPPRLLVDLGSGGGLPGLVLASLWTGTTLVLVEANQRRSRFLQRAVDELGYGGRVLVADRRAELVGREPDLRGRADAVVARGFGRPAVTAECAAPLLRVGGYLVVSEPPRAGRPVGRWPEPPSPLDELGLVVSPAWTTRFHYQSLVQIFPCPDRFPRRVGVPAKRPLF